MAAKVLLEILIDQIKSEIYYKELETLLKL
jgi:hypothetical protein